MKFVEALDVSPWRQDAWSWEPLDGLGLHEPLAQSLQGSLGSWLRIRQDIRGRISKLSAFVALFAGVSQPMCQRKPSEEEPPVSCQRTTDTACGTAKRQNGKAPLSSPQAAEGTVGSIRSPFDAVLRNSFRMLQLPASTLHMLPPRI